MSTVHSSSISVCLPCIGRLFYWQLSVRLAGIGCWLNWFAGGNVADQKTGIESERCPTFAVDFRNSRVVLLANYYYMYISRTC